MHTRNAEAICPHCKQKKFWIQWTLENKKVLIVSRDPNCCTWGQNLKPISDKQAYKALSNYLKEHPDELS